MTDAENIKAFECCEANEGGNPNCKECPYFSLLEYDDRCYITVRRQVLDIANRQQAEIDRLEIELKAMRGAANSYKAKNEVLQMDNKLLQSDIIFANQNYDHIKGLWENEKIKAAKAKQKVLSICKKLQTANAEIERLTAGESMNENVYCSNLECVKEECPLHYKHIEECYKPQLAQDFSVTDVCLLSGG